MGWLDSRVKSSGGLLDVTAERATAAQWECTRGGRTQVGDGVPKCGDGVKEGCTPLVILECASGMAMAGGFVRYSEDGAIGISSGSIAAVCPGKLGRFGEVGKSGWQRGWDAP